jgi:hypothetical protein
MPSCICGGQNPSCARCGGSGSGRGRQVMMTTDVFGRAVRLPQPPRKGFGKTRKFPVGAVARSAKAVGNQRQTSGQEATKPNRPAISGVAAGAGSAGGDRPASLAVASLPDAQNRSPRRERNENGNGVERGNPHITEPTYEELKAQIAALQAKQQRGGGVSFKVGDKGGVRHAVNRVRIQATCPICGREVPKLPKHLRKRHAGAAIPEAKSKQSTNAPTSPTTFPALVASGMRDRYSNGIPHIAGPTHKELNAILADLNAKKQRGGGVNKARRMKLFEEFWEQLLNELKNSRKVRDWTAEQGYLGGTFEACSFRYLNQVMQNVVPRFAHFSCDPNECIVGKRLYGTGFWVVSKQDFQDRYHKWVSYSKPRGTTRKAFEGEMSDSTYLIALFKEFEHLMR